MARKKQGIDCQWIPGNRYFYQMSSVVKQCNTIHIANHQLFLWRKHKKYIFIETSVSKKTFSPNYAASEQKYKKMRSNTIIIVQVPSEFESCSMKYHLKYPFHPKIWPFDLQLSKNKNFWNDHTLLPLFTSS